MLIWILFHYVNDTDSDLSKELNAYHHYLDEQAAGHDDDARHYLEVRMCVQGCSHDVCDSYV